MELTLSHRPFLDSCKFIFFLRVEVELIFECSITSKEGIDISSNNKMIISVFVLESNQIFLHEIKLLQILLLFRTQMSINNDVVISYNN